MSDSSNNFDRQITLSKLQQNVQTFKETLIKNLGENIDGVTKQFLANVESDVKLDSALKRPPSTQKAMYRMQDICTIYNIAVALLLLQFLNTFVDDIVTTGRPQMSFDLLFYAFGRIQLGIFIWICMHIGVLIAYKVFHYWAVNRQNNSNSYDRLFLLLYVAAQMAFLMIPPIFVVHYATPPATSMFILCEQIRLIMKCHAFVRENVPKIREFNVTCKENSKVPCPPLEKFVYFLFVPTLVYRDEYPRTSSIRWSFVFSNLLQVVFSIFYVYYIVQRFAIPTFENFGKKKMSQSQLVSAIFGSVTPGFLIDIMIFYCVLHCWMNAFAEITQFGDRLFYRDWWNATNYASYYRTWNIVVHDWIYNYIYYDVHQLQIGRNASQFVSFFISAVIHEYIIAFSFGYFYPILLFMFSGCGVFFMFLTGKRKGQLWNILFWTLMCMGLGLLLTAYFIEGFARKNCPRTIEGLMDYFVPRSWTCSAIL